MLNRVAATAANAVVVFPRDLDKVSKLSASPAAIALRPSSPATPSEIVIYLTWNVYDPRQRLTY